MQMELTRLLCHERHNTIFKIMILQDLTVSSSYDILFQSEHRPFWMRSYSEFLLTRSPGWEDCTSKKSKGPSLIRVAC